MPFVLILQWTYVLILSIVITISWTEFMTAMVVRARLFNVLPIVGSLQNLDQLYGLVFSAHETTCCDMTYTLLKATLKPK